MRWRFVDRILDFEPWATLRSLKAVSFEEYNLLERHGRAGAFPECLVLESCVESVRWLVAASSGFESAAMLVEVSEFRFMREAGMGDRIEIEVKVLERAGNELRVECRAAAAAKRGAQSLPSLDRTVAQGALVLETVPLSESFEREDMLVLWNEIHGAS